MKSNITLAASVFLALSATLTANAQDPVVTSVKAVPIQKTKVQTQGYDRIGDAMYDVFYEYRVQTTIVAKDPVTASSDGGFRVVVRSNNGGDISPDQDSGICDTYTTILQLGARESRFLDYLAFRVDSLSYASAPEEELAKAVKDADRSAFYFEPVIFQNWPEGNLTVDDILVPGTFTYTEERALEWTFGDGQKEVCGYVCREARTSYGGRDWIVWYAPEIASSAGPWKLCGLPGLILEAQDADGIHHFTATGLRQAVCPIVRVQDAGREKTRRDRFINRKNASGGNSFDNVPKESITSIDVLKNDNGGVIKINGRIPIRMNGHVWIPLELR